MENKDYEEENYIEWGVEAPQNTLMIQEKKWLLGIQVHYQREKNETDGIVWTHSGNPGCGLGFMLGFCYGRFFIMAGEASLLITHIMENRVRWESTQDTI